MAKPVADIVGTGGLGVQLRDDWSWVLLPGQRLDVLTRAILDDLQALGRYGRPVPNLHDTAVAGATIVPGGEVVKWWADHSDDRDKAIARYRRQHRRRALRHDVLRAPHRRGRVHRQHLVDDAILSHVAGAARICASVGISRSAAEPGRCTGVGSLRVRGAVPSQRQRLELLQRLQLCFELEVCCSPASPRRAKAVREGRWSRGGDPGLAVVARHGGDGVPGRYDGGGAAGGRRVRAGGGAGRPGYSVAMVVR